MLLLGGCLKEPEEREVKKKNYHGLTTYGLGTIFYIF